MNRSSGTLDRGVRIEIEIVLERMRNIFLNKRTRDRIGVLIGSQSACLWEEADMVTLGRDHDNEFWLEIYLVLQ